MYCDVPYGLTYKTKDLPLLSKKPTLLHVSSYFLKDSLNTCEVVVVLQENGKSIYSQTFDLSKLIRKKGIWEKVDLIFQLPQIVCSDYEFALFIENSNKNTLQVDDFTFKLY